MNKLLKTLAFASLAFAAACGPQQKDKTKSLKDVVVPPGFDFRTSRPVDVAFTGSETLLPGGKAGHLVLSRADGRIVYDGFLTSKREQHVRLTLPTKDQKLIATLETAAGQKRQVELALASNAAAHRFE